MEEKGVNELCSTIKEDSRRQAEEILRRAEEKVSARIAQAKAEAERAARAILRQAEQGASLELKKGLSRAQLDSRKMELQGREALIGEVLQRLRENIGSLRGEPGYAELLMRLVTDAAEKLAESELEIAVAERDRPLFSDACLKKLAGKLSRAGTAGPKITLAREPVGGTGVVVRGRGGRVELDNTLEARMSRMSRELRLLISKILFEEK